MAFDGADNEIVLFGGYTQGGGCPALTNCPLGDTWVFFGGQWMNATPATPNSANTPSPRWGAAATFDAKDGYLLLFGGINATYTGVNAPVLGDTWRFLHNNWTRLCGSCIPDTSTPVARWDASLAYDPLETYCVLFGGVVPSGIGTADRNDTWSFSGTSWSNRTTSVTPSARQSASFALDNVTKRLVLYGGFNGGAQSWEFGAGLWTQLSPGNPPSNRGGFAAATDPLNGSLVAFGGCAATNCPAGPFSQTWGYKNGPWYDLSNAANGTPGARYWATLTTMSSTELLLFGGMSSSAPLNDTWMYTHLETNGVLATHAAVDVGQTVGFSVNPSGGFPPYSYSWSGLPVGCSSAAAGPVVGCTTSTVGSLNVTVLVRDKRGELVGAPPATVLVSALPSVTATATPPNGSAPLQVSFTTSEKGGTGAILFAWIFGDGHIGAGAGPAHIYLTAGAFLATVWANDSVGGSGAARVNVTVSQGLGVRLTFSPGTVPAGNSSTLLTLAFGGQAPYHYRYTGLAACHPLNGTGAIEYSCRPTAVGNYSVTVTVTDAAGRTASESATLLVTSAPPPTSPSGAGSTGFPGWAWAAIAAAVAVAVVATLLLLRRRRRNRPIVPPPHQELPPMGNLYVPPPPDR